jgi:hypothetical protein
MDDSNADFTGSKADLVSYLLFSDAFFPPNAPPSSPHGVASVPFALPSPFSGEVDTSFSRSIDAVLATQTEREVAEEYVSYLITFNATPKSFEM